MSTPTPPPAGSGSAPLGSGSPIGTDDARPSPTGAEPAAGGAIELRERIAEVGLALQRSLGPLVEAIPGRPEGPQRVATALGVDKVLASRLLKSLRQTEPLAVVHHAPGPEPLRRLVHAAGKKGVPSELCAAAEHAIDAFETLVRREVGDRSALGAILSAWLPEARGEFELRRKQSAFKALSQLKGASCEDNVAAVLLHPSDSGANIDVLWVMGLLGIQRLRPGVGIKLATRRMVADSADRHPVDLEGRRIEAGEMPVLEGFCERPPARAMVERVGEVVHYLLRGEAFGQDSAVDHLTAELNLEEMPRFVAPESGRRGYVFAEVPIPSRRLVFDVFVHDDIYPGAEPELIVYDTALGGVADVNDRSRDLDRLEVNDRIELLGRGLGAVGIKELSRYPGLLAHVFEKSGWSPANFRGYRVAIDFPIYGSQIALAFRPPAPPRESGASA